MKTQQIIKIAVDALEDKKGQEITVLDTTKLSPLFSSIIICSGTSTRQVHALAKNVVDELTEHNITIIGIEGQEAAQWILVDSGEVVIHIMLPQVRTYYDLEELWGDQD